MLLWQNYIVHLKSLGYGCANPPSQADWERAYNHPEWFGARWKQKADERAGESLGNFLNFCRQYNY